MFFSSASSFRMSKSLSLIQRESFFDDSFFQDAWKDFDTAIQKILDKFDTQGLKVEAANRSTCTDLYRKIRLNKIDEDLYKSQALQVTEVEGKFQCVMDVRDFKPDELKVRVVDDSVVVEGKYEKKSEDGKSMSSKAFYKEFTLPKAADIEQVATALSKDGVLTIKAPKKEGVSNESTSGPVTSSSSSSVVQQSSSSVVQESSEQSVAKSSSVKSSSSVSQQSFSSSSSFSSATSKSVSMSSSSSSSTKTSGLESLEDMAKEMKDRLVFTHETVNLKLPESK